MDQILKPDREPTGGLRGSLVEDVAHSAKKLRTELHAESEHFHELGRNAYRWRIFITGLTVVSSAAAAILVLDKPDWMGTQFVAAIALVPGLCAGAMDKFQLLNKENWYYRKYDALAALVRKLDYITRKPPTADEVANIAKAWTKIEFDTRAAYEQFAAETELEKISET